MIHAIMLMHPQSANLLADVYDNEYVRYTKIACGTTKVSDADLFESSSFFPNYASWNSALFETSVILTAWEHADSLIGDDHIAIIHSDLTINSKHSNPWGRIHKTLDANPDVAIGLTAPIGHKDYLTEELIPDNLCNRPQTDPMMICEFDNNIRVWDYIKKYDGDLYDWAIATNPIMIYAHQFAVSRKTFDVLGHKLYSILHKMRLTDCGLWTPHVFERLIALYLTRYGGQPIMTTAFWHHVSSRCNDSENLSLYGPRPFRYYRTCSRWNQPASHSNVAK